jgi:hypothetical protein
MWLIEEFQKVQYFLLYFSFVQPPPATFKVWVSGVRLLPHSAREPVNSQINEGAWSSNEHRYEYFTKIEY